MAKSLPRKVKVGFSFALGSQILEIGDGICISWLRKGWLPSAKLKRTFTFLGKDFARFNTFTWENPYQEKWKFVLALHRIASPWVWVCVWEGNLCALQFYTPPVLIISKCTVLRFDFLCHQILFKMHLHSTPSTFLKPCASLLAPLAPIFLSIFSSNVNHLPILSFLFF